MRVLRLNNSWIHFDRGAVALTLHWPRPKRKTEIPKRPHEERLSEGSGILCFTRTCNPSPGRLRRSKEVSGAQGRPAQDLSVYALYAGANRSS